jgi:hypothetical protein
MTKTVYLPLLLAGLMAAAGAQAQSAPSAGSTDGPPKAGEASNQTMGVPNARTTNSTATEAPIPNSRDVVRQEAQGMSSPSATSPIPPKAGEATTAVQGAPNVEPAPRALSRAEVQGELLSRRVRFEAVHRTMRNPDAAYGVAAGAPLR